MFMIPDTAWKFGAGRYIQRAGALEQLSDEVLRLGKKPLLIAGERAWAAASDAVTASLGDRPYALRIHKGSCSEEAARLFAGDARDEACDVIVGIGGGVMMDTAKLTAELAGLPVITVPTITATCAAYAPLSVVYTPEGQTRGSWFFEREVSCILADLNILSRQPLRYAAAGIADSMAKMIEIEHNLANVTPTAELAFARMAASYLYQRLEAITPAVSAALDERQLTPEVEEMVYLTIPVTGIVSGAARGQMQSALGHCLYESIRTAFTKEAAGMLHGELVGIGLQVLLSYDGKPADALTAAMDRLKLPQTLTEAQLDPTEENCQKLLDTIMSSEFVRRGTYDRERMARALRTRWPM